MNHLDHAVPYSIGRRLNLAVCAAFMLVLLVGGISVLLAAAISRSVEEGTERGLEAEAVDRIHRLAHGFVADLHLAVQGGRAVLGPSHGLTLEDLTREIAAYERAERAQDGDEARLELVGLDRLKSVLARLESVSRAIVAAVTGGQPWPLAELEGLNALGWEVSSVIDELHDQHRRKFQRTIDASQQRMRLITLFYGAFAASGGLLLLLGNRFISRVLVVPITELAQAALHIARGDLSKRVTVRRGDEVGQLAQTFNLMAVRLEAHEADRLSFEAHLEQLVKERTRTLEETTARLQATQADLLRAERIAVTGQIGAHVTHRIRTPLNSLAIHVQLLRRELAEDHGPEALDQALDTLATVEYEVTRINAVLDEFVRFARLPTPQCARVELGPLLHEILRLLEPQAAVAGVRVETPQGALTAEISGDRDQLREVFLNLGQNALQAMPDGGVIGLELVRTEEWVEVAVTDHGVGIPEAEQEAVFLPFVTTKPDGLGLGLAIVKRIVEEHGGRVFCRDGVGGGAVFTVRLPTGSRERAPDGIE